MTKQQPDWSQFTMRIHINRPTNEVYNAWAIPKNLKQWFLEEANFTQASGEAHPEGEPVGKKCYYQWKWHNWNGKEEGEIIAANGEDQLSFTFGKGGTVHVQIKTNAKGKTELILNQEDIPKDNKSKMNIFVGCSNGWTFWLTNLKAWLEHGVTLHAKGLKEEETANLVNT